MILFFVPRICFGEAITQEKRDQVVTNLLFNALHNFSEGVAAVKRNNKYGFINKHGEFVIAPQFDDAEDFSDGLALVKIGGRYGFIDKQGRMVLVPRFVAAHNFSEGLAVIMMSDNTGNNGFIGKHGKIFINQQFGITPPFLTKVTKVDIGEFSTGKYGFIDKKGVLISIPQFDEADLGRLSRGFLLSPADGQGDFALACQGFACQLRLPQR